MELIQKNDSVLAGATRAGRDSNGGYSCVSRDLRYRYVDNGVLPTNTGIVAFAVRDAGLDESPGMAEVFERRVPADGPPPLRTARRTTADGQHAHSGSKIYDLF
jgi:hypothetical protein